MELWKIRGKKMETKGSARQLCAACIILVSAIQGCGGGGGSSDTPTNTDSPSNNETTDTGTIDNYSGSESQATVDETNAKDLAVAAAAGVTQAVKEDGLDSPFSVSATAARSIEPTEEMSQQTTAEICTHGGEAIVEAINDETNYLENVFSLNNCSYGEGLYIYTFTGTVESTFSKSTTAFDYVMTGELTPVDGISRGINWRMGCDANFSCYMSSDFQGFDGRNYRVAEFSVNDDGNSVFTASGRIYDPYHGFIDVTTEIPFTLDCPDGHPGSGRLSFTGANETSGYIEFVSCTEYVVATSGGTSNSYNW
jgi:hypothetical protein